MAGLADRVRPWSGTAYRHIPAASPYGVRDLRYARRRGDGRWHVQGQPTLYLAGDQQVAVTEFARHLAVDRDGRIQVARRTIYSLSVVLERTIDLRDPGVLAVIGREDAPGCWLDARVCRAVATFFRDALPVQGLVVPSIAFLDDPARWNLVCFLERLAGDSRTFLTRVRRRTTVEITPLAGEEEAAG